MHKITLVCSVHRENGLCNADDLLKILRAIEPEVVFEEMRPSEFDLYYEHGSVEAHAINKYRKFKLFQPVPVDKYDMPKDLLAEIKRDFDSVLDCVARASQEHRLLCEENDASVHQYGFSYLNSVAFAIKSARMSEIEEMVIRETYNQNLIRGLERWRHFVQSREHEMVGNIYEYCRKNTFDTGVFLVGAAHKTGIAKEAEKYISSEADLINWNFAYDGLIASGST